jgi:hypothetical protein
MFALWADAPREASSAKPRGYEFQCFTAMVNSPLRMRSANFSA